MTSGSSAIVKEARQLKQKKFREESGLFLAEGLRSVREALNSDWEVVRLFVSETVSKKAGENPLIAEMLDNAPSYNTEVLVVPDHVAESISDTESPQGIVGVVKARMTDIGHLAAGKGKSGGRLVFALDNIRDPGNMGTIFRSAHAAAFSGILLSERCADLFSPKTVRASMGSIFKMPSAYAGESFPGALEQLEKAGFSLYAASTDADRTIFDVNIDTTGSVFVIGNEAEGISGDARAMCGMAFSIPMPGGTESLNAAVAASIIAFECVRRIML